MSQFLNDRRKALEEQFFARYNKRLVEELRRKEKRQALAEVSGIEDEKVLNRILALDIDHETFAALNLVPIVEVAWADGKLQPKEREAILRAAAEAGIDTDSQAYGLLDSYLEERPPLELMRTWKAYVAELCGALGSEERESLRDDLLARARGVAEAAGGFLGANRVSDEEHAILQELEEAFGASSG